MKTFTKPQGIEMSCLATGFEEWPSIKSSKCPHMLSLTARSQLWLQVTLILPWSWCGCRWEGNLAAIYYIYHLLIFLSWFCLSDLLGGVPFFPLSCPSTSLPQLSQKGWPSHIEKKSPSGKGTEVVELPEDNYETSSACGR